MLGMRFIKSQPTTHLMQFRKGKVAAQQTRGFGALCPGLPMLRIQQGESFVHIQGAGMALFLPGIAHLRGHVFCHCAAALLKAKIRARSRQLSGHGAFGIAKAKQPRQIGLNVPLGDGFWPAKVGILPAQKFCQLRQIAAVGLERIVDVAGGKCRFLPLGSQHRSWCQQAAAERRVMAANAEIGVAEAAYYPELSLSASGGYRNTVLADLFNAPNLFWSLGPSLAMSLFDGGARSAAVESARASLELAGATYKQTVLTSLEDIENAIFALDAAQRRERGGRIEGAVIARLPRVDQHRPASEQRQRARAAGDHIAHDDHGHGKPLTAQHAPAVQRAAQKANFVLS